MTWESSGEAILDEYCQPFDASEAPDRHGAPPAMPPDLSMADEDRYRMQVWRGCDAPKGD